MEYFIVQHNRVHFEVAKFDGRKHPEEVYDIVSEDCNCPSPRRPCKHVIMVRAWLRLDSPQDYFFDTATDGFVRFAPAIAGDISEITSRFLRKAANDG